jgi:predicted DNA-binding transcriptional regulator AlpA
MADELPKAAARRGAALPHSLAPRGLSREQAAAYVGVSTGTFDRMVADGLMPKPMSIYSRKVWDRNRIDAAMDNLSGGGEADSFADWDPQSRLKL